MSAAELLMDVLHGNLTHAYARLTDFFNGMKPELKDLVSRLASDEGNVAYTVAKEAWDNWMNGEDLLDVAKNAASDALSKGLTVAEKDIADWLGIIDRANPAA